MTVVRLAVPAAQYLRMSTEHQQYSLKNQSAAIHAYADAMGFTIIRNYVDEGKSGLLLKSREALQQLLCNVVSGAANYKAILVYDVSRWGRFQDADEAAHYEFLCRHAGIQVHYCAEAFASNCDLSNSLMKTLKRVMAGEYSRELSLKVHEGTKRISESGFRTGGSPSYGLRRMLVSYNREPKHLLARGERKSIQSDRVTLEPGPENEVNCVRDIFRMFTQEHKWPAAIAGRIATTRYCIQWCEENSLVRRSNQPDSQESKLLWLQCLWEINVSIALPQNHQSTQPLECNERGLAADRRSGNI